MPDQRSLLDRVMDFVDYHLSGTVTDRPSRKARDRHDHSGFAASNGGSSSTGFDDCGDSGGGGDCSGGDGGGGGD